jgi:hypothetical protein
VTTRKFLSAGSAALAAWVSFGAVRAQDIVVSIPDQTLALTAQGRTIARYPVSTSKFGAGDIAGSFCTPLGTLFVSGKFGDHLPAGSVIKNRALTGEIIAVNALNRDAIVSRVIWLRGMETENFAAHDRCIYIHGTPEERRIGQRASFGCIRMRSRDIIVLYDQVHIGMHVMISLKPLDDLIPTPGPG